MKYLVLVLLCLSGANAFADTDGIYKGTITSASGHKLNLVVSLQQTDMNVTPSDPDSLFQTERKIAGSFVLDDEAGPYAFSLSEYDPETGKLILQYGRLGSTGTPSSIPNLTFQCTLMATGKCSGSVISGLNGPLGTFELQRESSNVTVLVPKQKYFGTWNASVTYTDAALKTIQTVYPKLGKTNPFTFNLIAGQGTVPNPDNFEIASTPMKAGELIMQPELSAQDISFTTIIFDYFKGEATCLLYNTSPNGNNANVTWIFDFDENLNFVGSVNSFRSGMLGTIKGAIKATGAQ